MAAMITSFGDGSQTQQEIVQGWMRKRMNLYDVGMEQSRHRECAIVMEGLGETSICGSK